MAEIASRAASLEVLVHRLASFAVTQPPQAGLVLGYGAITPAGIKEGLSRLRGCLAG